MKVSCSMDESSDAANVNLVANNVNKAVFLPKYVSMDAPCVSVAGSACWINGNDLDHH